MNLNQTMMKIVALLAVATLAAGTQSCSNDDSRKELRSANDEVRLENKELRQENKELRERVAMIDKQLALQAARSDEAQRANDAAGQKNSGVQLVAQEAARKQSEAEGRLRTEQIKQQAGVTVKKIAAQMDRLLEEIPSLEGSLDAWDASMPKLATFSRDGSMQLNLLVAELDGLKFERSDDLKLKIVGFSNGYQSLPGVGRLVLSSREHAATLRALAKPSESDLASAAGEEVAMTAQLSVFNATLAECKRLRAEVSQLAN